MADNEKNLKRMNSTISSHDLPDDIIFIILSKSTVKSLLRFTGVSKSINTLIRSSTFVATHHHNQIHNKNNNKTSAYVVSISNETHGDDGEVRESCFLTREINAQSQKYNLPFPFRSYYLVGVCEGLVCFAKGLDIYIWNPFIGSTKQLPPNETIRDDFPYLFNFSKRSCDYKVIKQMVSHHSLINLEIYSLATDSWRRMEYKHSGWVLEASAHILFKRFMYWMGITISPGHKLKEHLIRFDLDQEIFAKVAVSELHQAKLKSSVISNDTIGVHEGDPHITLRRNYFQITLTAKETLMLFDEKDKV